ncbi:MAG: hypothetical protein ACR2MQ_14765 [Gemmatimonadaceae bacterium]
MRHSRSYSPIVALALFAVVAPSIRAQAPGASVPPPLSVSRDSLVARDSTRENPVLDPVPRTRGLAGSARIFIDASALRFDGGLTTYNVAASFAPFLSEHVQVGVAPSYTRYESARIHTLQSSTTALIANYVFGGGTRWREYVGGYGSMATQTNSPNVSEIGAQGGALFFLSSAVALRGELRYREITSPGERRYGNAVALVTLDPYVSGRADEVAPTPPGLGVVDLAVLAYHARYSSYNVSGISGTIAPYLARWAQVGVDGAVVHFSDYGDTGAYRVRGFGRGYVPLTARTQPFAEGFAESSTYNGNDGGLTDYGGALGVREMLNAHVALDVGVRRTLESPETFGPLGHSYTFRSPGTTALFVGVVTRLGRAR